MIKVRHKGNLSKATKYLIKLNDNVKNIDLDRFGVEGVNALKAATPVDSGKTADSWYYKIERTSTSVTLSFHNSNINKGVPIAVILQYGHGTRNGGWVQGRDYINPALQPLFDKIAKEAWREVTKL